MRRWIAVCVIGVVYLLAGGSSAEMIDFNSLPHGHVVDDDFEAMLGVTIITENFNKDFGEPDDGAGLDPDLGIIFDTRKVYTLDSDLEGPPNRIWRGGNLPPTTDLGAVLIIQANDDGCDDGHCRLPDDEPGRSAGQFVIELSKPHKAIAFDLVDVEWLPQEIGRLSLYDGASMVGTVSFEEFACAVPSPFCVPGVEFGNRSANRIPEIPVSAFGGTSFNRVVLELGGSGGIDNLLLEVVPEPGTAGLIALGLLGIAWRRRQT